MQPAGTRIDWVDHAKGLCIVMVVMMHSTLGVETAYGDTGFMGTLVAFAKPFRMPDFFLIAGLFLARVIDRDWRDYADRKVVHFLYFYVLWVTIQFAARAPGIAAEHGAAGLAGQYVMAYVEPFGTLWFIYILPLFFVVTKLMRRVPAALVWLAAAGLQMAPIATGWTLVDEFAARYVYFYSGYVLAPHIFALAVCVVTSATRMAATLAALAVWAAFNGALVFAGLAELPGVGLVLGFLGAAAMVAVSALLARSPRADALAYLGRNSIVIYLAFFLPMAASRVALGRSGLVDDPALIALAVTTLAVAVPLLIHHLVARTPARFLFRRPAWAHLGGGRRVATPQIARTDPA